MQRNVFTVELYYNGLGYSVYSVMTYSSVRFHVMRHFLDGIGYNEPQI